MRNVSPVNGNGVVQCPRCSREVEVKPTRLTCENCGNLITVDVIADDHDSARYVYLYNKYEQTDKISISSTDRDGAIRIDMKQMVDEMGRPSSDEFIVWREIIDAVKNGRVPEWYEEDPYSFLIETVEGQMLLEYALTYYGINLTLNLNKAKYRAYRPHHPKTCGSKDRWEDSGVPEIDPMEEIIDNVDEASDEYVYVLRLFDSETDEEMLYVGKSKNILNRLKTHINSGGDFSASTSSTHVYEVKDIVPEDEVTEREMYEKMEATNNIPVHGGK